MQQSSALLIRQVLSIPHTLSAAKKPAARFLCLDVYKACQGGTYHAPAQREDKINRNWIVVQRPMSERVQSGLYELAQA